MHGWINIGRRRYFKSDGYRGQALNILSGYKSASATSVGIRPKSKRIANEVALFILSPRKHFDCNRFPTFSPLAFWCRNAAFTAALWCFLAIRKPFVHHGLTWDLVLNVPHNDFHAVKFYDSISLWGSGETTVIKLVPTVINTPMDYFLMHISVILWTHNPWEDLWPTPCSFVFSGWKQAPVAFLQLLAAVTKNFIRQIYSLHETHRSKRKHAKL
jgi:hypothetical protein